MEDDLYSFIEKSASVALEMQQSDGSMPRGHNGPYYQPETPVRNTSHWLVTFVKAYRLSGKREFHDAARRATQYLLGEEARPTDATFWHLKNPVQGVSNGVIGQAWTLEALVAAYELFDGGQILDVAEEVFLLHPFQEGMGLWQSVGRYGEPLELDYTLNHQIWFAAAGALLARHVGGKVQSQVTCFLDNIDRHFRVHSSGLIKHRMPSAYSWTRVAKQIVISIIKLKIGYDKLFEIGYHQYNLYGLALLFQSYPEHSFWGNSSFRAACTYLCSEEYRNGLPESPYGFSYNPPGFEIPYVLETFSDIFGENTEEEQSAWISAQIDRCYDSTSDLMESNCHDPATHAARIYEATRLPNLELTTSSGRLNVGVQQNGGVRTG